MTKSRLAVTADAISFAEAIDRSEASIIGDNHASFDQVVEENLLRGLYLVQLQALQRCIRDPRLDQRHRLVLVALSECTNAKSGMAYPGRAWLAANAIYHVSGEVRRYSEGTIANTLSELADLGYLMVKRQAPGGRGRALAHYVITPPSIEDLQAKIAEACAAIRAAPKRPFPSRADVNPGVEVRPEVKRGVEVKTGVEVRTRKGPRNGAEFNSGVDVKTGVEVSPEFNSGVGAEFNSRVGQELVKGTGKDNTPPSGARKAPKVGSRLPPDWKLPPEWAQWARERFVASDQQIATEAEKFRDYWHAKAGRDATKLDWAATWRTWWNNGYHKLPRRAAPGAARSDARRVIDAITGGR